MVEWLKQRIYQIKHRFESSARTYQIACTIRVENTGEDTEATELIIPLPQESRTQEIVSLNLPENVERKEDEVYGNTYGYTRLRLEGGETKSITYTATLTIKKASFNWRNVTTNDYQEDTVYLKKTPYTKIDEVLPVKSAKVKDILRAVNTAVIKRLTYGNPINGLYAAEDAKAKACVDCGGFTTYAVGLLRNMGVPARVVAGFWLGENVAHQMHSWGEILLPDGNAVPFDPSTEQLFKAGRVRQPGRLGSVGVTRMITSYGTDIPVALENETKKVPILQHPYVFTSGSVTATLTLTENPHA